MEESRKETSSQHFQTVHLKVMQASVEFHSPKNVKVKTQFLQVKWLLQNMKACGRTNSVLSFCLLLLAWDLESALHCHSCCDCIAAWKDGSASKHGSICNNRALLLCTVFSFLPEKTYAMCIWVVLFLRCIWVVLVR